MTRRTCASLLFALMVAMTAPAGAHDDFRIVGSVVALDARARTLTVRMIPQPGDDADVTERNVRVALPDFVTLERDRKPIALADIVPGLWVVVDAQGHDYTDLEAVKVRVVPPPPGR